MMSLFNLTLSEKHFILPSILNDSFAGYSNLGRRSLRLILGNVIWCPRLFFLNSKLRHSFHKIIKWCHCLYWAHMLNASCDQMFAALWCLHCTLTKAAARSWWLLSAQWGQKRSSVRTRTCLGNATRSSRTVLRLLAFLPLILLYFHHSTQHLLIYFPLFIRLISCLLAFFLHPHI